jgi:hypothetical protein
MASVTGLALDLVTTGEHERLEEAMDRFLPLIRSHAGQALKTHP